jgi:hypothetical protein
MTTTAGLCIVLSDAKGRRLAIDYIAQPSEGHSENAISWREVLSKFHDVGASELSKKFSSERRGEGAMTALTSPHVLSSIPRPSTSRHQIKTRKSKSQVSGINLQSTTELQILPRIKTN